MSLDMRFEKIMSTSSRKRKLFPLLHIAKEKVLRLHSRVGQGIDRYYYQFSFCGAL